MAKIPSSKRWIEISALLLIVLLVLTIIGIQVSSDGSALIASGQQEQTDAIKTLSGEINPFKVNPSQSFLVALSPQTGMNFTYEQLSHGITLSDLCPGLNANNFKITFDPNNNLIVNANITDANGRLIGKIIDNRWQLVNQDDLPYWDRNYNAYALEIIGIDNFPIFQVMMVGSNEIQIGGLFYESSGRIIYFQTINSYNTLVFTTDSQGNDVIQKALDPVAYMGVTTDFLARRHIPRIFEYPALTNESNLGKLAAPLQSIVDNPIEAANSKIQKGNTVYASGATLLAVSTVCLSFPLAVIGGTIYRAFTKTGKDDDKPIIIQNNFYVDKKTNSKKRNKRKKASSG